MLNARDDVDAELLVIEGLDCPTFDGAVEVAAACVEIALRVPPWGLGDADGGCGDTDDVGDAEALGGELLGCESVGVGNSDDVDVQVVLVVTDDGCNAVNVVLSLGLAVSELEGKANEPDSEGVGVGVVWLLGDCV